MFRRHKKRLLTGVAVVAVLAGVTAAVVMAAQPGADRHGGGTLATAAGYLGLSQAQLRSELQSGKSLAEIANATGGRSSAGLIAALETAGKQKLATAAARLPMRVTAEVDRVGGRDRTLAAAAGYLGVSESELRAERRSGETLAQIAKATSGKSEAGLIEALVAARKARIAAEVKAGAITQAQANQALPDLASRVTAQVNRARRAHGSRLTASGRRRRSSLSASAPASAP
jgi:hypothetical protein